MVGAAVLLFGITQTAGAQSGPSSPAPAPRADQPVTTAQQTVDVSRLPIDMRRIRREFRQASERDNSSGLNLQYFVEVYAPAPPLVFLTKEDNLRYGPVPYGAPTHRDMLWMLTPQEFRGSLFAMPMFRLPVGGSKKAN